MLVANRFIALPVGRKLSSQPFLGEKIVPNVKWLTITTAVVLAFTQASPAAAQRRPARPVAQAQAPVGCIAYDGAGFSGRSTLLRRGTDIRYLADWNDRISSISCREGCSAILFEHPDYAGQSQRYATAVRTLGAWAGKASSVRVRCEGRTGGSFAQASQEPACVIFADENFRGAREAFGDGEEINRVSPIFYHAISSVRCRVGCEITAFEDAQFRGESGVVTGNRQELGPWNDRIGSLMASCR